MKKLTLLLSLFVCTSIFAQDWQKYKYEDLGLIASFPGKPERSVQKVPTAIGDLDMHMVIYSPRNDDNAVYSVIRSDYPESQFEGVSDEYNKEVLDGAVQGAVNNVKGTLVFDKTIKFNGYPGRSIKIDMESGFIYINAYLVKNSMFITQVICLKDKDNNASIKKFLNHFDIIKVKK